MNKKNSALLDKLKSAELEALIDRVKNPEPSKKIIHHWSKNHIRVGFCSDLHYGSNFQNQSSVEDTFKRFRSLSVDAVYLSGDITEGYNMRQGHSLECSLHGADAQVKGVVENLPCINKPVYFIAGDHDHSHFKNGGVDIGKSIEKQRKDLHYLGFFNAQIEITKNCILELSHPAKGTAYALSYHPQKMAESFSGGEKPHLLVIGHYHKIEYLFYRNIHIWQAGTLQNQTGWMRRMNLSAHLGSWVVDLYTKKDGSIDRVVQTLFPYY